MEHNGNPSPFYFSCFDKKCKNMGILLKVVKGWRPQTIIYIYIYIYICVCVCVCVCVWQLRELL